ncbi:2-oxoglutarate dehydrogenase E2 component (dihydrolipoamide succinyltransferase) [Hamadaea flava]|uniref:Dihydrolipoamide acetyltransferase component of pyruvate dehydrogenase complex n=1 Tax=Hamadaea flava TaxID=1742688 RepID=A0ABV8LVS3_9ACTN|nr:2-oxoglutarate dehydrogenase, E2 component, dihydrolipoamide succinyltransferase [Hamadaea flava]MCP2327809.1 2-oxoglutarate dehydrogenase E2 component (dihydrolipoamide succinyltransferase) [Hamadaea flava]
MPVSVTLPALGESVTEGTVTRWLKSVGDRVEVDEPLLEVSTDKVDTEIPSPSAGVVTQILVAEDETAEVGAVLAVISDEGEAAAPQQDAPAAQPAAAAPAAEAPAPQQPAAPAAQPEPAQPAAQAAPQGGGEGTPVTLPALGESVTEGTVTRWLKSVGDAVEVDEPLLEVSTDKVDTEIPSPVAGTLLEIKVAEDETAPVGAVLALVGAAGGAPAPAAPAPAPTQPAAPAPQPVAEAPKPAAPAPQPVAEAPKPAPAQPAPAALVPAQPAANGRPTAGTQVNGDAGGYVTPLVRKLAAEHGVNLGSLNGTGVGGRIRKQDVLDAAAKAKAPAAPAASAPAAAPAKAQPKAEPSPLRGRTEKLTRMRQVIAKRMVESLQVSAQLTTVVEVDVTKVAKLREQAKKDFLARHGVKLSFLPFFALAAVEALRQHPSVNAKVDVEAGTVTYFDVEHLGMAVDTPDGLMVPVIHNAGDLNLAGLAKRIGDIAERTRSKKLTPDEISGGTFTLTNTGSRGALFDTPIINQPQVAILGTGSVVKRAVVVDDPDLGELIVPRYMVYLALSYDHRLVDGADAARYLTTVKERLEAGNFEADLGL